MPRVEHVAIPLAGLRLTDGATRESVPLESLGGVHVLVLMRHRH